MRNYFPSESARNFFGTINVGYGFPEGWTFPDVVAAVAQSFTEELTADRLRQRMNEFSALEPVSYTHLDVYKRQYHERACNEAGTAKPLP